MRRSLLVYSPDCRPRQSQKEDRGFKNEMILHEDNYTNNRKNKIGREGPGRPSGLPGKERKKKYYFVGAVGVTVVFVASTTGEVGVVGVGTTDCADLTESVTASFACSLVVFTVDFAASDSVVAGWFSAIGSACFSLLPVDAASSASEIVSAG